MLEIFIFAPSGEIFFIGDRGTLQARDNLFSARRLARHRARSIAKQRMNSLLPLTGRHIGSDFAFTFSDPVGDSRLLPQTFFFNPDSKLSKTEQLPVAGVAPAAYRTRYPCPSRNAG